MMFPLDLQRALQIVDMRYSEALTSANMTTRQVAVLSACEKKGSQTDLVTRTGIDRSTMADIVRRLVKRGWIKRQRTREDARAYAVTLTPDGVSNLSKARSIMAHVDKDVKSTPAMRALHAAATAVVDADLQEKMAA